MKEYKCADVDYHMKIPITIKLMQKQGWNLHTYQAVYTPTGMRHFLLFERETSA